MELIVSSMLRKYVYVRLSNFVGILASVTRWRLLINLPAAAWASCASHLERLHTEASLTSKGIGTIICQEHEQHKRYLCERPKLWLNFFEEKQEIKYRQCNKHKAVCEQEGLSEEARNF